MTKKNRCVMPGNAARTFYSFSGWTQGKRKFYDWSDERSLMELDNILIFINVFTHYTYSSHFLSVLIQLTLIRALAYIPAYYVDIFVHCAISLHFLLYSLLIYQILFFASNYHCIECLISLLCYVYLDSMFAQYGSSDSYLETLLSISFERRKYFLHSVWYGVMNTGKSIFIDVFVFVNFINGKEQACRKRLCGDEK